MISLTDATLPLQEAETWAFLRMLLSNDHVRMLQAHLGFADAMPPAPAAAEPADTAAAEEHLAAALQQQAELQGAAHKPRPVVSFAFILLDRIVLHGVSSTALVCLSTKPAALQQRELNSRRHCSSTPSCRVHL